MDFTYLQRRLAHYSSAPTRLQHISRADQESTEDHHRHYTVNQCYKLPRYRHYTVNQCYKLSINAINCQSML